MKGRLLYAAGHTHGRCTQLACQLLRKFSGHGPLVLLTVETKGSYAVVSAAVSVDFTVGAVEDDFDGVTYGALMVDLSVGNRFYFGGHIPSTLVDDWRSKGKKQVIAQAELFPIPFCFEGDVVRYHVSKERALLY